MLAQHNARVRSGALRLEDKHFHRATVHVSGFDAMGHESSLMSWMLG
jgi:hypothetical protein